MAPKPKEGIRVRGEAFSIRFGPQCAKIPLFCHLSESRAHSDYQAPSPTGAIRTREEPFAGFDLSAPAL